MNHKLLIIALLFFATNSWSQTILFSEDFEGEALGDIVGTSAEGIGWTSTCPNCVTGDIFEVDNTFGTMKGLRGNDTNGPATMSATGIDATGMYILILEFDYESSGYVGSGNLECDNECTGCSGDPADVLLGGCNNCWDFLLWELSTGTFTDGNVVLGNNCTIADNGHVISNAACSSPYDVNGDLIPGNDPTNLSLTISMAMWASAENMVIDNIVLTGYTKAEAVANGLINSPGVGGTFAVCPSGSLNLFDFLTNVPDSNGYWSGPSATTGDFLGTVDLSTVTMGDFEYIVATGNGCEDTTTVTITSGGVPPTVSISGNNSICLNDTTTLTASGTGNYTWSTGETSATIEVTSPPQNISITSTNSCGTATASITINSLGTIPTPTISGTTGLCDGDSLLFVASGGDTYLWSGGFTNDSSYYNSAQTISLTATNVCGDSTISLTITSLGSAPLISVSGIDSICIGDTTTLTASGFTNYTWSTGETSTSINVTSPQNIFVYSSNACGVDSAFIDIISLGNSPSISIIGTTGICVGDSTTLVAQGDTSYTWSDGSISDSASFNSAGTIYVVTQNICGSDTAFAILSDESVIAQFSASDSIGTSPLTIDFSNSSINANSYSWFFGDGQTSSETNPSHTYMESGQFTITLIAFNSFGCSDTTTQTIQTLALPEIEIPNVFTPNGDGSNNLFIVNSTQIKNIKGTISNRWGQTMFNWNDKNTGWDGYYNDKQAPEGTYYYVIEVTLINNQTETYTGAFSLFR